MNTPQGMVYFEGGNVTIGSSHGLNNESPTFVKKIEPFYLDKHLLTVAQFRKFVKETGYVTQAEEFGDASVFNMDLHRGNRLVSPGFQMCEKCRLNSFAVHKFFAYRFPLEFFVYFRNGQK